MEFINKCYLDAGQAYMQSSKTVEENISVSFLEVLLLIFPPSAHV